MNCERTHGTLRRGFTLIELLVVVGVLVLVASLAAVAVAPLLRGRSLRSGGGAVRTVVSLARSHAATHRTRATVHFEAGLGRMTLYGEPEDVGEAGLRVAEPVRLPTGVEFLDNPPVSDAGGKPYLIFAPTGSLDGGAEGMGSADNQRIRLTDANGERVRVVEVVFATGFTHSYDQ